MKLRLYFSFRSPFAAIALYRLRRLESFKDVDIELMPLWPKVIFGGHIDNPTDNLFKMVYIFRDAARQAALAGLDRTQFDRLAAHFQLPDSIDYTAQKVGVPVGEEHWETTHKACLYAANEGKGWAFADAVSIRRFNFDGEGAANVMDHDIIAKIAESVGLDGAATVSAITDPAIDEQMNQVIRSGEQEGVFGVPFFALEKDGTVEKFWGNDRLEHVLMHIQDSKELPSLPQVGLAETVR